MNKTFSFPRDKKSTNAIDISGYIDNNGCYIVTSHKRHKGGYYYVRSNSRKVVAHRLVYEMFKGKIPDGLCVCHSCDNPTCVNPDHLWLGTRADNNKDRDDKKRTVNLKGIKHGRTKLTEKDILAIRMDNRPYREIARDYGVYHTAIAKIKNYKTWKHI